MPNQPPPESIPTWNRIINPAYLSAIIECATDAIVSLDDSQHIILFNKGAEQIFGYRSNEALGQPATLLMPQEYAGRFIQRFQAFVADSKSAHFEKSLSLIARHKSGSQFPAEASIIETTLDGETVYTAIIRNVAERQSLIEALRISEERLKLAIDSAQDALWDWNIVTGETVRNARWAEMLGYNPEEVENRLEVWERLIHPDDRPIVQQAMQDHLDGRAPLYELEYRLQTATGDWKWVLSRGRVVERDETGRPRRMTGTHTDIGERKRVEAALQAERDFALQIMNTMGQGLTVVGADMRFEYVNPAYARMLGRQPEDLIGRSPTDFTFAEDQRTLADSYTWRMGGETTTYETRLRHAGGNAVHALITGTPRWREGKVDGAIAVVTDLTERKQAEAALRESEAQNRALLSAIPDLMFRNRRDGTYLSYHSPALTDLLAEHPSRFLGRRIADIQPPDVARQSMHYIEQALETGEVQLHRYQLALNGVTRHFEARIVASGDDEVLTIVRDISEQARLEQMKSDFINRAAHELRTPLATTLMMVNLIEEGGPEEETKQYWQILRSELKRQHELVEELLTMGRLESDTLRLNVAPLDLSLVLLEAISATAPLADAKAIQLQIEIAPDLSWVNGDKGNLRQAFINLLNNAVKFTPANGNVWLQAVNGGETVAIQIRDTGIGIPPEDLPHLFGRFFRAGNATQNEIPGSGVGLYIVKATVEKLGGQIRVESEVGLGTMFEVQLPAFRNVETERN